MADRADGTAKTIEMPRVSFNTIYFEVDDQLKQLNGRVPTETLDSWRTQIDGIKRKRYATGEGKMSEDVAFNAAVSVQTRINHYLNPPKKKS